MTPPTTKSSRDVPYAKIPAPPLERCAKCGDSNIPGRARLWRVKDEGGPSLQCDVCAHCERPYPEFEVP